VVAVIDTGLDFTHPDITGNVWVNPGEIAGNGVDDDHNGYIDDVNGWNFVANNNSPIDGHGHGTHVAGTIAAVGNNGIGVIGVAFNSKVMVLKGLDDSGVGYDTNLANAIYYAVANGADVISNSWGGRGFSQVLKDAIDYAWSQGVVVVAAAANDASDVKDYFPAGYANVITVAASSPYDGVTSFSNYGVKIDVTAPGVDILSLRAAGTGIGTIVGNNYVVLSGTSMAAPHVSGTAALILARNPTYTNEQVRQALRSTAADLYPPGFDVNNGYGRLNAGLAVAQNGTLESKIQVPGPDLKTTGLVAVSGLARGTGFQSWTLDYGSGDVPTTWTTLATGASAVGGGTFATLDTSVLTDGPWVLRLRTLDTLGRSFEDRVRLFVNYVEITSPVPPSNPTFASVIKPGTVLPIQGTATGGTFQNFQISWAEGINPTSGWSTTGITLAGKGTSPITAGLLGQWDTSAITQADYYTIQVTVQDSGFTSQSLTLVYLEPSLLSPNWPQWLDQGPTTVSHLLPARNSDGTSRLVLVNPAYFNSTKPARLFSFPWDASSRTVTTLTGGSWTGPAVGDVDPAPGEETVVGDLNSVRIVRADGTSTVLSTGGVSADFTYASIVLADLNGDGKPEILAVGTNTSTKTGYLFAWKQDGTQVTPNFPVAVPDYFDTINWGGTNRIVVVDLFGDGKKEILLAAATAADQVSLRLFNADGTPRSGWSAPTVGGFLGQLAAADLAGDGQMKLVVSYYQASTGASLLTVLGSDGTPRPGWPYTFPSGSGPGRFALGDLDLDGKIEIVASAYYSMHVLRLDGTPFSSSWPRQNGTAWVFGSPVLADIDGDGYPEILVSQQAFASSTNPLLPLSEKSPPRAALVPSSRSTSGPRTPQSWNTPPEMQYFSGVSSYIDLELLALKRDATVGRSWRLLGADNAFAWGPAYISVGDFNQDGKTDIAVNYILLTGLTPYNGNLVEGVTTAFTLNTPYVPASVPWPNRYGDPQNRSMIPQAGSPLRQDPGTDGIVAVEAEDYDLNVPQGGHTWTLITSPAGFSGAGAMESDPNTGANVDTGYVTGSPRLDFQVNFVKTGTHYVWVRGWGQTGSDDSCHVGLDGQAVASAHRISSFVASWGWSNATMDGTRATLNIATPGLHTINLWMREDGFRADKILLTTTSGYTPSGTGPAESPRGGLTLPTVSATATVPSVNEAGTSPGVVTIGRTGSVASALTVSIVLSGTAVNGTDYSTIPSTVTIPAGSVSVTVPVSPINDFTFDGNQSVVVSVVGGPGYAVAPASSDSVTIVDTNPLPVVTVTASSPTATEPGVSGAFQVSRTGNTASALTVSITLGGTAINGTDYVTIGQTVVIPAGSASATVTVTPIDDFKVESNETVLLTVSPGTGYSVGSPSTATVTIIDVEPAKTALFVVGNTTLGAGDAAIKTRLQNSGYTVTVKQDTASVTGDATGKTLVVISSTVTSANVNSKFRTVTVPIVNWESALLNSNYLGMAGPTSGTDFGTATGQTALSIVTPSHAMAAGLSGSPTVATVSSTFSWGKPNANAVKIATLTGDATRVVIFGYPSGASMPGLVAPARRVHFFLEDLTAANINSNGWALFDAAVAWAAANGTGINSLSTAGSLPAPVSLNGQGDFTTIQEAADRAVPGDTIILQAMRYYLPQGVVLKGGVSLRGASPQGTILDGQGTAVVLGLSGTPQDGRSTLALFTVTGGNTGIHTGTANVLLQNLQVVQLTGPGLVAGQGGQVEGVSLTVADNGGAGIVLDTPDARIRGAISARNGGRGIDSVAGSSVTYTSTIGNAVGPDSVSQGIDFENPAGLDYRVRPGSVSIDAGDPTDDYSLEPSPNGGRINQGAFGNTPFAETSAVAQPALREARSESAGASGSPAPGSGGTPACGSLGLEVLLLLGLAVTARRSGGGRLTGKGR
jgi:hypothetical protein